MIKESLLNIKLKDDSTPYGGTAFEGETVNDFLSSLDIMPDKISLKDLNNELKSNGIQPITEN